MPDQVREYNLSNSKNVNRSPYVDMGYISQIFLIIPQFFKSKKKKNGNQGIPHSNFSFHKIDRILLYLPVHD